MTAAERRSDPTVAADLDEIRVTRNEQHWWTRADADEARGRDMHDREVAGGF